MPDFLAVLIHPRPAMRRILDRGRYQWIPLVMMALIASAAGKIKPREILKAFPPEHRWALAWINIGAIVFGLLICVLLFYGLSFIAHFVGRAFEGTGAIKPVRAAAAWGMMPLIVSVLYRLPLSLWMTSSADNVNPAACGAAVIVGAVELATLIWYAYVGSACLAEAHQFSFLRGFATLAFTFLTPLILTIAAILTFH